MRHAITIAIVLSAQAVPAMGQTASREQDAVEASHDRRTVASAPVSTLTPAELDLNTADQRALETLPGIGPKTAALILEYRTDNGAFSKEEELMNIRGIGERTFLRLRDLVGVGHADHQP